MVDRLSLTFALLSVALSISSATCVGSKLLPPATKTAVNAAAPPMMSPPATVVQPVTSAPPAQPAPKHQHVSRSKK